tara:strand:+ start:377 stop:637 length:261 start_codon:yes stop_codon:yes gene_type:complete
MILTGKQLMKLREEYARNVVEHMSAREMHCYLIQIFYNDIACADGVELKDKLVAKFGQEAYDSMVEEITTSTSNKPHPAIAELTID